MDRNEKIISTNAADRRSFLAYFSGLGLSSTLFPGVLWAKLAAQTFAPQNSETEATRQRHHHEINAPRCGSRLRTQLHRFSNSIACSRA